MLLFSVIMMDYVVHMHQDALTMCQTHAQLTDTEEIMGLLIGFVQQNVVNVVCCMPLVRSDKRKDRVEVSPMQMVQGVEEAERLTGAYTAGETYVVVGWYHSHPHITVQPSHVDVRTQRSFETMSKFWVGVIVSVFNTGHNALSRVQVSAFQSVDVDAASGSQLSADEQLAHKLQNLNDEQAGRYFESSATAKPATTTTAKTTAVSLQQQQNDSTVKDFKQLPVIVVPNQILTSSARVAYRQMLIESLHKLPELVLDELDKENEQAEISSTAIGLDGNKLDVQTQHDSFVRAHEHCAQLSALLVSVGEPLIQHLNLLNYTPK